MIGRPLLSSSIGKTISNSLKSSLNFQKKTTITTTTTTTTTFFKNEFKNQFSTTNNNKINSNNINSNSSNIKKEPIIKDFDEVFKEEMEKKLKRNNTIGSGPIPISGEAKLIFENNSKYKYKLLFFCAIVQVMLFLFVLEDFLSTKTLSTLNYWAFVGASLFTILTFFMIRDRGVKSLASIHTYNKGRVIELTSYSITGFPTRKRILNVNNIISSSTNDSLPSPLTNQIDKTFFIRFPGQGYYEGSLKDSIIIDPITLDKLVHISKAGNAIKDANKAMKKQRKQSK
ncbi:hypothetical protein ACTA71_012690 [Dictyostelium dimigraforme]